MPKPAVTLGSVVAERRATLGLTLKALGLLVRKEDGSPVTGQYLNDIEHNRRTPSAHTIGQLARALGIDAFFLRAVSGEVPGEITNYLKEYPDTAATVAALFVRARLTGFVDWGNVSLFAAKAAPEASGG